MEVKTHCNSILQLLEHGYPLRAFTPEWPQNLKHSDYRLLFTTDDEWTIVNYVMEGLRPLQYRNLWMLKRHTVTLHHVITVYNDLLDNMDDLFIAVKLA
jgi:hypothetical protein